MHTCRAPRNARWDRQDGQARDSTRNGALEPSALHTAPIIPNRSARLRCTLGLIFLCAFRATLERSNKYSRISLRLWP